VISEAEAAAGVAGLRQLAEDLASIAEVIAVHRPGDREPAPVPGAVAGWRRGVAIRAGRAQGKEQQQ